MFGLMYNGVYVNSTPMLTKKLLGRVLLEQLKIEEKMSKWHKQYADMNATNREAAEQKRMEERKSQAAVSSTARPKHPLQACLTKIRPKHLCVQRKKLEVSR